MGLTLKQGEENVRRIVRAINSNYADQLALGRRVRENVREDLSVSVSSPDDNTFLYEGQSVWLPGSGNSDTQFFWSSSGLAGTSGNTDPNTGVAYYDSTSKDIILRGEGLYSIIVEINDIGVLTFLPGIIRATLSLEILSDSDAAQADASEIQEIREASVTSAINYAGSEAGTSDDFNVAGGVSFNVLLLPKVFPDQRRIRFRLEADVAGFTEANRSRSGFTITRPLVRVRRYDFSLSSGGVSNPV